MYLTCSIYSLKRNFKHLNDIGLKKKMSHNSKYYVKRLKKEHVKSSKKILDFFKSVPTSNETNAASTVSTSGDISVSNTSSTSTNLCENAEIQVTKVNDPDGEVAIDSSDAILDHSETSVCNDGSSDSEEEEKNVAKYDRRLFSADKYERSYPWLYWSCSKNGYVIEGEFLGTHPTRKLQKHNDSTY